MASKETVQVHLAELPLGTIWVDYEFNARKPRASDGNLKAGEGEKGEYDFIKQLAAEMKSDTQLSPIRVRPLAEDDEERKNGFSHELIYGFRRYEAAALLEWSTIRCEVGDMTDEEAYIANIAENVQRDNIFSYDLACRLHEMKNDSDMSGRKLAVALGKSSGHVNNLIKCIDELSPQILRCWRNRDVHATTDGLIKAVLKTDDFGESTDHDAQWKRWLIHCGLEEKPEKVTHRVEGEEGAEEKVKPPSKKHVKAALEALKTAKAQSKPWKDGATAALRFVLAELKTLPKIYNPEKPPKTEEEEDSE